MATNQNKTWLVLAIGVTTFSAMSGCNMVTSATGNIALKNAIKKVGDYPSPPMGISKQKVDIVAGDLHLDTEMSHDIVYAVKQYLGLLAPNTGCFQPILTNSELPIPIEYRLTVNVDHFGLYHGDQSFDLMSAAPVDIDQAPGGFIASVKETVKVTTLKGRVMVSLDRRDARDGWIRTATGIGQAQYHGSKSDFSTLINHSGQAVDNSTSGSYQPRSPDITDNHNVLLVAIDRAIRDLLPKVAIPKNQSGPPITLTGDN